MFTAITTIIRKEWAELYKNTLVLSTVIFMPLLFAGLPLIILWASGGFGAQIDGITSELPPQMAGLCVGLSGAECNQIFIASQFTVLFMMIPLIIPATIAPYAIVGEKTQRSLEPLLATPIRTADFLLAKTLAAIIPGLLATWAAFILYAIGARLIVSSSLAYARLFRAEWLLAVFVLGTLLALFSALIAIMVSSRSNDPRAAQQVAGLIVLPVIVLFVAQIAGFLTLSPSLVLLFTLIAILLDGVLLYLAVHVFDRETILTRWA
ncbi:MAG: ABC transporter permease subunit [Caldilineales bacterium]|nr:ABC transporter permease subunit [Caldilineales bacterium]